MHLHYYIQCSVFHILNAIIVCLTKSSMFFVWLSYFCWIPCWTDYLICMTCPLYSHLLKNTICIIAQVYAYCVHYLHMQMVVIFQLACVILFKRILPKEREAIVPKSQTLTMHFAVWFIHQIKRLHSRACLKVGQICQLDNILKLRYSANLLLKLNY